MIKIGITGGTGLLGLLFKEKLKKKSLRFSEFKDDILKRKKVARWISSNKNLEYIFHFAAISSTQKAESNKKKAKNVNVLGTENLIKEINKNKKNIWFFFPSTSHVYDFSKKPIKENFRKKPISYYGKTKLLAERKIISNVKSNFSYFIGRIFSIYHKDQKKPFLYPSIKEKIKSIKKNEIFVENANSLRDFLDAEKVVNIIFKVYKKNITGVYNIGSGKSMSIKKFIKKEINSRIKIISNNRINSLVSNNNKLNRKIKEFNKVTKI